MEQFTYSGEYNYTEYDQMCRFINKVNLPLFGKLKADSVLADYIFSLSMKRMQFGWRNTIRRLIGSLFTFEYQYRDVAQNKAVFVFTGDGINRPDYVIGFNKVADQCDRPVRVYIDRTKTKIHLLRIPGLLLELLWGIKINKYINKLSISLDMAVYLFRAKYDAKALYKQITKLAPTKIVTFCDLMPIEGALTQMFNDIHIPTATMQHGNGNNIFYGSSSKYYLANSCISRANAIDCGMPNKKVIVLGPMKYAGESYSYKRFSRIRRLGIVFDGAQNYSNNIEMIDVIHDAVEGTEIQCCIRFHPNNKKKDYATHLHLSDKVYDDLEAFEKDIDMCIVYNSSMFTDMIYKKIFVYRYKNGVIDLFPELNDRGFSNAQELKYIIELINSHQDDCVKEQDKLFDAVFGSSCSSRSYNDFFSKEFV